MPPISKPEQFELRANDYVHFVCADCKESAVVTYLGLDPVIPRLKVECPECHKTDTWKIFSAHDFPALER